MTYQEWIQGTSAGSFSVRSSELKGIDKALEKYDKAVTPYGKQWEAYETRIALEKWKASTGPDWKQSERNKKGLIEQLDRELPPLRTNGNGRVASKPGDPAENLRKGVLFVLSNCTTAKIPANLHEFLNDGTDTSSDVQALVNTGGATGWRVVNGEFYDASNKGNGFLDSLSETLIDYIKELAALARLDEFAGEAARWVVKQIPDLLVQIFAGLLSQLSAAVDIGKGLVQAVAAARGVWKTRLIEGGVMPGHPRLVVQTVREQIKESGYDGIKEAVSKAMLAGIGAIPGAGTVLGVIAKAIASVWAFVSKAFDHFRAISRLTQLFKDAAEKLDAELYKDAGAFYGWFRNALTHLPIISSYCMTMPLLGSYYGFLTLVGTDGTEMNYKQLERNYGQFNDVKSWASEFVKDYSVKIQSSDPIVARSLAAARGEKQQWDNAKQGVFSRVGKIAIGVIETAAGDVARRG